MKDVKQLLLDKIEMAEILKQNYAKFFNGEIKEILRYIQELEKNIRRDNL